MKYEIKCRRCLKIQQCESRTSPDKEESMRKYLKNASHKPFIGKCRTCKAETVHDLVALEHAANKEDLSAPSAFFYFFSGVTLFVSIMLSKGPGWASVYFLFSGICLCLLGILSNTKTIREWIKI